MASGSDWVTLVFEKGFLLTGATLCASLLDFENEAHLTNEPMPAGLARWWEIPPGQAFWRPRQMEVEEGTHFPYGQKVSPP